MAKFFAELKRRQIYRVAAAYAVVAWLLLQLVNNLTPLMRLPDWAGSFFLTALIVGFPVALLFAWIQQLGSAEAGAARSATGRLDGALFAALIVVIGLVSYQQLAPNGATTAQQQPGVEAAKAAAASPSNAISLAVLPFANMSGDASQEFFSDGITEEITSALARIPDLRVVARTSAFEFKNQNRNIQNIGQQLKATHLIEGSVRKAGERVRITVQLIKADDGTHVWSENYDRELTDIFAIQEEIGRSIATSFNMRLGLAPGESLVNKGTDNPVSHENYLRARSLLRARDPKSVADAIKILEEAVARDPGFAPAWGLLATAYHFQLLTHPAVLTGMIAEARPIVRVNLAKAEAAAQQAIKLDPKSVDGHFALGQSRNDAGDRLSAIDLWRQTLTLDPDYPDALQSYSILLTHMGFSKDAIPVRDHLLALEPLVPAFQGVTARVLFGGGQTDAAISILKGRPSPLLAQIYAAQGRYREAADVLENVQASFDPELAAKLGTAAKLLRAAPAAAPENDRPELGALNWVYFHAGAPERFLKTYEDKIRVGFAAGVENGLEWAPVYSSVRKTEQFKAYVRNAGILTYWRERGWPDLCKPVGADDFACE